MMARAIRRTTMKCSTRAGGRRDSSLARPASERGRGGSEWS
jgi:hypothetical protein